jgi:hypothetical protein
MKFSALSWWLVGYGAFVFTMGVLGYLSNPEKAVTALKSGGTVAALSVLWAAVWASGRRWGLVGAVVTIGLVTVVFIWRSTVSWLAYFGGDGSKLVAACLITAMLGASLTVLPRLVRALRTPSLAAGSGAAPATAPGSR